MLENYWKYTKRIMKHKFWVGYYAFKAGLYWQGLTHDLSKFSPAEFFPYAKYFTTENPSGEVKDAFTSAWLHHKAHNPHHYEYWINNPDDGGEPVLMPYKYATELVCDYLGACRAYEDNFSYKKEYEFWITKRDKIKMHPQIKHFVTIMLEGCSVSNSCAVLKQAKYVYNVSQKWYEEAMKHVLH